MSFYYKNGVIITWKWLVLSILVMIRPHFRIFKGQLRCHRKGCYCFWGVVIWYKKQENWTGDALQHLVLQKKQYHQKQPGTVLLYFCKIRPSGVKNELSCISYYHCCVWCANCWFGNTLQPTVPQRIPILMIFCYKG